MTLDGVDVGGNFGKDRRRIARTGTDFEYLFAASECQCLGHERDDIGLRDCLSFFNRQGSVVVGKLAKPRWQKGFARHSTHSIENQFGSDASREDGLFNHLLTKFGKLPFRKLFHRLKPTDPDSCVGNRSNGFCATSPILAQASSGRS